ncbi:hypothetical protein PGB90_000706 [Kerria lacca]
MEDSIKSTPLKYTENTNNKQQVEELQQDQYVIDEEPSKLKDTTTQKSNITMDCADNEKYNLVIVDVQDENKYLNNSDDEHFLIALSVVQSAVVVRIIANIQNLDETRKNEYDLLKSMLQLRLREVETETDAFRGENSYLGKLRDDYEKEYSKFCSEKVQFLAKII